MTFEGPNHIIRFSLNHRMFSTERVRIMGIKKVIVLLVLTVFAVSCGGPAQRSDKWIDLFDGKTLDGWIQRGGVAKYQVKNETIVGTTVLNTPNSFLCTEKDYSDFILELEFKVDEALNSGIQIRSNVYDKDTTVWMGTGDNRKKKVHTAGRVHGYQVEIDPSQSKSGSANFTADGKPVAEGTPRSWTGGIYDEGRRGWLNDLSHNEAARNAFKPGKWNLDPGAMLEREDFLRVLSKCLAAHAGLVRVARMAWSSSCQPTQRAGAQSSIARNATTAGR